MEEADFEQYCSEYLNNQEHKFASSKRLTGPEAFTAALPYKFFCEQENV